MRILHFFWFCLFGVFLISQFKNRIFQYTLRPCLKFLCPAPERFSYLHSIISKSSWAIIHRVRQPPKCNTTTLLPFGTDMLFLFLRFVNWSRVYMVIVCVQFANCWIFLECAVYLTEFRFTPWSSPENIRIQPFCHSRVVTE